MLNENEKKVFQKQLEQEIQYANTLWDFIKNHSLENEQFVLDWLDSLNEISIRN